MDVTQFADDMVTLMEKTQAAATSFSDDQTRGDPRKPQHNPNAGNIIKPPLKCDQVHLYRSWEQTAPKLAFQPWNPGYG